MLAMHTKHTVVTVRRWFSILDISAVCELALVSACHTLTLEHGSHPAKRYRVSTYKAQQDHLGSKRKFYVCVLELLVKLRSLVHTGSLDFLKAICHFFLLRLEL